MGLISGIVWLFNEIQTIYHIVLSPIRGITHKERLESFYAGQAKSYDSYRQKLLCCRETLLDKRLGGKRSKGKTSKSKMSKRQNVEKPKYRKKNVESQNVEGKTSKKKRRKTKCRKSKGRRGKHRTYRMSKIF